MTPKQARRILRESTRRERRDTFRGIYKYSTDGGVTHYVIDQHGIPTLAWFEVTNATIDSLFKPAPNGL
jgi:hypothetical protein